MLYPNSIAAVSDASHPSWRAQSLSVYRIWRDLSYAIGALAAGIIADLFGAAWAIAAIGAPRSSPSSCAKGWHRGLVMHVPAMVGREGLEPPTSLKSRSKILRIDDVSQFWLDLTQNHRDLDPKGKSQTGGLTTQTTAAAVGLSARKSN